MLDTTKPYAIVEFDSEDEDGDKDVDVISCSWLSADKSECYWPSRNVSKEVERHTVPKDSWTTHKIKILKTTGSKTNNHIKPKLNKPI
jgi:hypothetical protein